MDAWGTMGEGDMCLSAFHMRNKNHQLGVDHTSAPPPFSVQWESVFIDGGATLGQGQRGGDATQFTDCSLSLSLVNALPVPMCRNVSANAS